MTRARGFNDLLGVWSSTTRGEYVTYLQSKKSLSKASIHSYCWRLETLFRALCTDKNAQGDLDRDQIRQLIQGNLAEAERLVAQDDRRSHWRLLKEFLELPEEALLPEGSAEGDLHLSGGGGGGGGGGGDGAGEMLGDESVGGGGGGPEVEGKSVHLFSSSGHRRSSGPGAGGGKSESKVWDMELKKDYRAWLRQQGIKERTCGSYCTFVHNLLRALADARKPSIPHPPTESPPLDQQAPPQASEQRLGVEDGADGADGGLLLHEELNGTDLEHVGTGDEATDGVVMAAALLPTHEVGGLVISEEGEAGVLPRREGLNRQELIELLDEQYEEAQRIVRQSKKNRYLRSFRDFLGMSNHEDLKAKATNHWTDRVGGGYKTWVGAGHAGGSHARTRGYVGAARSILRTVKRKGWVHNKTIGSDSKISRANVLQAIEENKEELQVVCDKADDERLEAFLQYLRAGHEDGSEDEEGRVDGVADFHFSSGASSMGGDDEEEDELGEATAGSGATEASGPKHTGGNPSQPRKRMAPLTEHEKRMQKRIRCLEKELARKTAECDEARARIQVLTHEQELLRANVPPVLPPPPPQAIPPMSTQHQVEMMMPVPGHHLAVTPNPHQDPHAPMNLGLGLEADHAAAMVEGGSGAHLGEQQQQEEHHAYHHHMDEAAQMEAAYEQQHRQHGHHNERTEQPQPSAEATHEEHEQGQEHVVHAAEEGEDLHLHAHHHHHHHDLVGELEDDVPQQGWADPQDEI